MRMARIRRSQLEGCDLFCELTLDNDYQYLYYIKIE